jgi:glutamate carboxypeptidase
VPPDRLFTDASAAAHPLLAWCRARSPEMARLLEDLVAIESPSTEPSAVAALARRIDQELSALGMPGELVPVESAGVGAGPILRARGIAASRVMLLGHLDTVWDLGTVRRRPARIEGGRLFGAGAFDMKGGIVVLLYALKALKHAGLSLPATVFLTPLEEVGCEAYRGVMESEMRASAAVLDFEPAWPGGAVKTQRKGSATLTLRARGVAAHAGADFARGANAILELSRRLLDAAALTDLDAGITLNVGTVQGGTRANVVPDEASAQIDVRFRALRDGERVCGAVERLAPSDARLRLEVERGSFYPPLERTAGVAATFAAARDAAAELGLPALEEIATGGASEASFAAALGVPTLDGLGPDGDGAHAEHEHVILDSLPDRAALAAVLISKLASLS